MTTNYPVYDPGLQGWSGALWARFKPRARLTRGLKTEAGALNSVCLMAQGMV